MLKVARFVPSSTPTTTDTPTISPSPTNTPTWSVTPTRTPTKSPSRTATALRSPTSVLVRALVITQTLAPTPQASPTIAPPLGIGGSYSRLSIVTNRAQPRVADLNLQIRGSIPVTTARSLVDYTGEADGAAPQLASLFADNRTPSIIGVYQLYDWNQGCDCRGALLSDYDVSLIALAVNPGETLRLPDSGYEIASGFEAMVVYADPDRIVVTYTRSNGVIDGYVLYLDSVAVDPNLVALYQLTNGAGRAELPALRSGQPFAKAKTSELRLAIRDSGAFMDPRSRKDWWRGR